MTISEFFLQVAKNMMLSLHQKKPLGTISCRCLHVGGTKGRVKKEKWASCVWVWVGSHVRVCARARVCSCACVWVCVCVCACASVCESTLEYSREWEIKKKERDGRPTSNKQVHCPRAKQVSNTRCFNDTPRKRACAHLNEWECELTHVWVWVHASLFV